jgi:uncharacterized protein YlaI
VREIENNENTEAIRCCGCNNEIQISREAADRIGGDWFQCDECDNREAITTVNRIAESFNWNA